MKRLKNSRVILGTSIAHNTLSWSTGHTEKETGQAETTLPADRNLGGVANLAPLFPSDGKGRGFSFSGQSKNRSQEKLQGGSLTVIHHAVRCWVGLPLPGLPVLTPNTGRGGSQSVAPMSPENLLEMHIHRPRPCLAESEALEVGPEIHFNKHSKGFSCC